jgi:hypothetical protein
LEFVQTLVMTRNFITSKINSELLLKRVSSFRLVRRENISKLRKRHKRYRLQASHLFLCFPSLWFTFHIVTPNSSSHRQLPAFNIHNSGLSSQCSSLIGSAFFRIHLCECSCKHKETCFSLCNMRRIHHTASVPMFICPIILCSSPSRETESPFFLLRQVPQSAAALFHVRPWGRISRSFRESARSPLWVSWTTYLLARSNVNKWSIRIVYLQF